MGHISENIHGFVPILLLDTPLKQSIVSYCLAQAAFQLCWGFSFMSNVNLGAGVKLSNLRNDGKEVHVIFDGQRVPSGLRKFGAILGEGCQLGCNAVTIQGLF